MSTPFSALSSKQTRSKGQFGDIPNLTTTKATKRSLQKVQSFSLEPHFISLSERRKARTLERITPADLLGKHDSSLQQLNMAWQLCCSMPTKILDLEIDQCPNWNTFFTKLSPKMPATIIEYGPMIPSSPTDPSVVHQGLQYAVELATKIGMKYTVVTADQALYEIAYGLREKAPPDDETYKNLILMLGQFHLAVNYMGAVGKIMRNSGAEDILVQSGTCKLGTANKIFGPAGDYYQSMRAHKLLREALAKLHLDAFEASYTERHPEAQFHALHQDIEIISIAVHEDQNKDPDTIASMFPLESLSALQLEVDLYDDESKTSPTHVLWRNYINMIDILLRFTASHRNGDWEQSLAEASNMLPYIVAAGHHNYGYSLPLYLKEMNSLKDTAPEVYDHFMKGYFVV